MSIGWLKISINIRTGNIDGNGNYRISAYCPLVKLFTHALPDIFIKAADMVYISQLTNIYGDYLANTGRSDEDYKRVSDLMAMLLEKYANITGSIEPDKTHINLISKAAYFFDIGRMAIPDELIKNHKFAGSNMQLYETHTQVGAHIIQLNKAHACRYFVKVCSDICIHHHERFDGLG
ncbi:MAG: hypothetical protein J5997_10025 [Oscillospiraceae bacterium]|nr:hypothetical protein [Oscillospiraceae bacterium]